LTVARNAVFIRSEMKTIVKKYFSSGLLLLTVFCVWNSYGQRSGEYFERTYGDTLNDVARFVEVTSDGGIVVTGYHTVPTDTTCEIWVLRTDSRGDTLWTTSFGGRNFDAGYCVRETRDRHFVVCGVWNALTDNDPNDFSGDVFVSLIDPDGVLLWTWLYAGGNSELRGGANYIVEAADGNFVLTGGMRHTGYFKKHSFLLKLNRSTRTVMWEHIFPPEDYVSYTTTVLKTPSDSGFIITGLVYPPDHNGCDVYLVKTNSAGDTLWTNTIGEWGDYEARHMAATSDGGCIITGNTAVPPDSKRMAYLMKVDREGDYQWHKHFPTPYTNVPSSTWGVVQTADSGYAVTGYFPFTGTNSQELVLIRTDKNGDLLWKKGFGGEYYDKGYSISLVNDGFVLAGFAKNRYDRSDVFLIRTDAEGIISSIAGGDKQKGKETLAFPPYPNPTRRFLNIVLDNTYGKVAATAKDLTGNTILSSSFESVKSFSIDLENVATGAYLLHVFADEKKTVLKFVKE